MILTTEFTLFGGLIVVILLFLLARLIKLSAELSGLIAAMIPLLAYFVSLFGHEIDLDMVAMHMAIYIAAAFVMAVFAKHRQSQSKTHWVPKALIAFFIVLTVINACLMYVSSNGLPNWVAPIFLPGKNAAELHTGFSGTTRHGNEAPLSVNSDLAQLHHNDELGWKIEVEGLTEAAEGYNLVRILANDKQGNPIAGLTGDMLIGRPGDSGVSVPVKMTSAGRYEVQMELPNPGLWIVQLELAQQGEPWRQSWQLTLHNDME